MSPENDARDPTLTLRCPKCGHDHATLFVHSFTVLTVKCAMCFHSWSVDLSTVSDQVRRQVEAA